MTSFYLATPNVIECKASYQQRVAGVDLKKAAEAGYLGRYTSGVGWVSGIILHATYVEATVRYLVGAMEGVSRHLGKLPCPVYAGGRGCLPL